MHIEVVFKFFKTIVYMKAKNRENRSTSAREEIIGSVLKVTSSKFKSKTIKPSFQSRTTLKFAKSRYTRKFIRRHSMELFIEKVTLCQGEN